MFEIFSIFLGLVLGGIRRGEKFLTYVLAFSRIL
jgi:hypothetical protein